MIRLFLILFLSSLFGCVAVYGDSKDNILEIRKNGLLIESRHYTINKMLESIVHFKSDKFKSIPIDSIFFKNTSPGNLDKIFFFSYSKGHYKYEENVLMTTYYQTLLYRNKDCPLINNLVTSYDLFESLRDICNITTSVLPNGEETSILKKERMEKYTNNIIITYDNLNSRFNGLSNGLQSYFYHKQLNKLCINMRDHFLVKEEYFFENGKFTREHSYQNQQLERTVSIIHYNDSKDTISFIYEYVYKCVK